MRFTRRRSDRPDPARRRLRSSLETLEKREVLTTSPVNYYTPQVAGVILGSQNPHTPQSVIANVNQLSQTVVAGLGTSGKVVSGTDRLGNQWEIVVQGPGQVVVTDATPNDGVLDDDLDTIQLVGTDPKRTTVTGGVSATSLSQTSDSGLVQFNKLISQNGVKSIVLNGFVLAQTVNPPNGGLPYSNTGIYLPAGAQRLEFTGVRGNFDIAQSAQPLNIIVGDPNIPLKIKPTIRIDEITNTVFNSSVALVPTTPQTLPSINIIVNGDLRGLELVSSTEATIDAAEQYFFPLVGTTGRTSIQTTGIDTLNVTGSAINTTVSRTATPFQGSFSSVSHIKRATFGGNADALALDVKGRIGGLRFAKGLGSSVSNSNLPANYGVPYANTGYPANGLMGGAISAGSIGHINVGPQNETLLQSNNPDLQQSSPGTPLYFPIPGVALASAAVTTTGSIGSVKVLGDSHQSEIKTGFSLTSYAAGFSGQTGKSHIGKLHMKGSMVNTVVSASYTPGAAGYGSVGSAAGPGSITGNLQGTTYNTGTPTVLGNVGTGFYARHKKGYLPKN